MKTLNHRFVEQIPEQLDEGIIYVSIPFETILHKCCCGCGKEVVTPLSPSDWSITFDGETVSLKPSIDNWNFECGSHYWIRRNKVHWVDDLWDLEIENDANRNQPASRDLSDIGKNLKLWLKKLFK